MGLTITMGFAGRDCELSKELESRTSIWHNSREEG